MNENKTLMKSVSKRAGYKRKFSIRGLYRSLKITIMNCIIKNLCLLFFICSLSFNSYAKKMEKILVGSTVPSFELKDQYGNQFNLDSVLGKKNLVIYFYPKDDTPGCTAEACAFRDQFEVFKEADAMIIGISGQSVKSHLNFAEKHNLNFTLLSDEGNNVRKIFGVPTNLLGLIPGRVTYIVNKEGIVLFIFNSQNDAKEHVTEALRILNDIK